LKGTIQKRTYESGTTKWRARIDVPTKSGDRKQKSKTFDTEEEAERWLSELNYKIDHEGFRVNDSSSVVTLDDLLKKWLQHKKGNVSPRTHQSYSSDIENHILPSLGQSKLSDINSADIQEYYDLKKDGGRLDSEDGGLAASTIHQHHTILNSAFDWAGQMNYAHRNPIGNAKPPSITTQKMKVLDESQISEFLDRAQDTERFYTVYCVAVYTGMRRTEILGLEWGDIDLEERRLTVQQILSKVSHDDIRLQPVPKTESSRRTIKLPEILIEELKEHREKQQLKKSKLGENWNQHELIDANLSRHDLVFTEPHGKPIHPDKVTKHFKRLVKKMGLEFAKFHHLRHSHASIMLKNGTPIHTISKRLGHSDVSTTLDKYSHLMPGMEEEAVEEFAECLS